MPFCPQCGSSIQESDRFCQNCGASLTAPPPAVGPSPSPGPITTAPPRKRSGRVVKIIAVIMVLLVVIVIAAAALSNDGTNNGPTGGSSSNDGSSNSNPAPTSTGNAPSPTTAPADIQLSGSGDTVSSPFNLTAGNVIFQMSYSGTANFIVWLDDSTGKQVSLLANTIGSYTGSTLVGVTSSSIEGAVPGSYYLNVQASGPWNVTIQQPRPTTAASVPVTFTGTTDNVSAPFTLTSGAVKFTMSYTGSSNFAVWLYDANGNYIDLLANKIGAYSGTTSEPISGTGIYYLSVTGVGSWSIAVMPM